MTTSVEELIRDTLASVSSTVGAPLAARWVNNRYAEMVSRVRFRHLRQIGELSLSAVVDSGTVSCTRGSTTVTPDATAQAAWVTSPGVASHDSWYFRTSAVWYRIKSVDALGATITLDSAFAEDDVSSGSYKIVQRFYSLDSTSRWLGDFIFTRLRYPLRKISLDQLDMEAPGRILTDHWPTTIVVVGVDSGNDPMVEVYPPPDNTELIHYVYWKLPTALTLSSDIPDCIDSYTLKEGILIDLYRYEKVAQIKLGNVEAAAVFANEEAKQRTIWAQKIKDAIRTSRGSDDLTFILQMFPNAKRRISDQRTARDYVLDNWRS